MKRTHIAITSAVILGILVLVAVARGIGGVAAAGDERFKINGTTLTKYLGTDTFASIPDTVTNIGDEAFAGNETLTSVEIPDSVESISYNAFKDCTALTGVTLPDSVKKVGPGAFEGCTSLTSVVIGKGVSSWGTGVFTNCDSLARVSIDKENGYLTYYNGAIYNGDMTMLYQVLPGREGENYVMPDTVEDIDAYAFWNMMNTKNVKVSENVTAIPKYAMTYMGTVENVVIQDGTAGIAERAFSDNAALKQVIIPSSVAAIDSKAFTETKDLKICTSKSSAADTFGKAHDIEVIYKAEYPDDFMDSNPGLEEMPDLEGTPSGVPSDTDAPTEPSGGQTAADGTQKEPSKEPSSSGSFESAAGYVHPLDVPERDDVIGKTIVVAGRAVFLINNHRERVYGVPDGIKAEVKDLYQDEEDTDAAEVPDSIHVEYEIEDDPVPDTIAQREFYKRKDLTAYEIADTIATIDRLAFAESGLKAIDIPDNVTSIEYGAFLGCSDLADVKIPDTVSVIGTRAFTGTAWLEDWMAKGNGAEGGDFLIVGDGVLLAYRGYSAHVEIPDGVKRINAEVFKGHNEILDVYVPASVTKICAEAFRNCSELTGLTGCEGLKTVIRGAFYGTRISESEFK